MENQLITSPIMLTTRAIPVSECPWLAPLLIGDLRIGTIVYHPTYPVLGQGVMPYGTGDVFSLRKNTAPFFSLPLIALVEAPMVPCAVCKGSGTCEYPLRRRQESCERCHGNGLLQRGSMEHDLEGLEETMNVLGAFEPLYLGFSAFRERHSPSFTPKQTQLSQHVSHALSLLYQALLDGA